jgi:Tfp pilus assembly protein FimT
LTLVELLVVVALLGLAAAGVTMSQRGATDAARLRAATLEIEQTLRLARHLATTQRRPVWVCLRGGSPAQRAPGAAAAPPAGTLAKTLDGVTLAGATVRGAEHTESGNTLTIRVTPSGATLPWALELHAERAKRVVWTDGVTARVRWQDDLTLDRFHWPTGAAESAP